MGPLGLRYPGSGVRARVARGESARGMLAILMFAGSIALHCGAAPAPSMPPRAGAPAPPASPAPVVRAAATEPAPIRAGSSSPRRVIKVSSGVVPEDAPPPAPPGPEGEPRRIRVRTESGRVAVARVHAETDGRLSLLLPDGQIGFTQGRAFSTLR